MPKAELSPALIKSTVCPAGQNRIDLYDTQTTGLMCEIRASGGKTYALRFTDGHGRLKQLKLGDTQTLSLDQARMLAIKYKAKIALGENPLEEKRQKKAIPTLQAFVDTHYLPYVKGYKRSWQADESHLRLHILPLFGKKYLDQVTSSQLIEFHHAFRQQGYAPATANRQIILVRYLYNLARKWEIPGAEKNPATAVRLFQLNNSRERYLTTEETQALVAALAESDNPYLKDIVVLLLLTGCRKRELLDARWEDFDLPHRRWRIPMSKSGKARHVPLSEAAVSLIQSLPRWPECPWLVPNPKSRKPYVSIYHSWDTARKAAGVPDLRIHDLRHSYASFLVNAGRSIFEVQKILGHAQIRTTQRYSHLAPGTLLSATDAAATAAGLA